MQQQWLEVKTCCVVNKSSLVSHPGVYQHHCKAVSCWCPPHCYPVYMKPPSLIGAPATECVRACASLMEWHCQMKVEWVGCCFWTLLVFSFLLHRLFFPISLFYGYKCGYICPYVSSTYGNIHYCCPVLSTRINILIWFNNLVLMAATSAPFPSFLPLVPAHVLILSPPSLPFFLHSVTPLIPQAHSHSLTSAGQAVVIFNDCCVSPGDRFFLLHPSS